MSRTFLVCSDFVAPEVIQAALEGKNNEASLASGMEASKVATVVEVSKKDADARGAMASAVRELEQVAVDAVLDARAKRQLVIAPACVRFSTTSSRSALSKSPALQCTNTTASRTGARSGAADIRTSTATRRC